MTDLPRVPRFSALRDFVRDAREAKAREDRCELCAAPLASAHDHVLDREGNAPVPLACACDACARLLPARGRWRRVQRSVARLTTRGLDAAILGALGVPIQLVFLRRASAPSRTIAGYPSPAGIAEAPIDEDAWRAVVTCDPSVCDLAEETEALLVHRRGSREGGHDVLRVSIDVCFHLTGIVRRHWRGMSGGSEVSQAIDAFFAELAP